MISEIDKAKQDFAKRLNEAMELAGFPVRGRARALKDKFKVSDKGAGKWLKAEAIPETSKIPLIAEFLNVNAEWLLSGNGEMRPTQTQSQDGQSQSQSQGKPWQTPIDELSIRHDGLPPSRETPVISWVAAGDFTEVMSSDLSRVIEWIPYNSRAGKYGFALIVDGASMEPKFMPDDRIYVNPTFQIDELHTGDLVIMACDGDEKATFKELVVEDGNYYLRPLNPNWQPRLMPVDHNCRLIGKVVGRFNNFE